MEVGEEGVEVQEETVRKTISITHSQRKSINNKKAITKTNGRQKEYCEPNEKHKISIKGQYI